jgi:hypothetical protein
MATTERIIERLEQRVKDLVENTYTVVTWPDVQNYMGKSWFSKEAILDVDSKNGDSAYLIPTKRWVNS